MDKLQFAIEDFKNIQELIKFVDQKSGVLLVVYGFLLTTFVEITKNLTFINPFKLTSILSKILSIFCFLGGSSFIIVSVIQIYIILFKIIQPKSASNYNNCDVCLYYFDHIATQTKQTFITRFGTLTDINKMTKEVLSQIYEVSKILKNKQKYFCICTKLLFASIITIIIYALCAVLIK